MYTGIYFLIEAIFYMTLLLIMYFGRKRFKSLENKSYSILIIVAFIELFLELLLDYVGPLYNQISLISFFIARLYCCFLQFWITNLCLYVVIVTLNNKDRVDLIQKIQKIFYFILFILSILIFVLPIQFNYDGMISYTSGMSVNVVYLSSFVFSTVGFICIILNKKQIKNKKFVPMFAFLVIGSIGSFLQFENPGLLLAVPIHAFITFLMYFTIENPDMKLLRELYNSKEISDNANEEKTLFIYNLTQDIRSISGAIDDDADYILESKNWDETYECARNIKLNNAKFTTMTNEILDVSKIDYASIKTYNSKYNIKNVLKQVINVYSDICKNKELQFRTNIDHNIPEELYGDGIGLKEVLNTILSNSCKYTDKGFIEFSVNTIIKNDVCRLIITIEDSGTGIKSEDINKIKIDNKSLAKANKLITLMNGTMLISSDYGIGTKVKIILDQKIEKVENKEIIKYEKVLDNVNVLAVDDSEAGLKIIEKLLKNTNILLDKVMTGKECIDKIKTNKYDLILLDEELSQITANELIVKIKDIHNFDIPIVLLTKDTSYEYNEEYIKNGFAGYILKPLKKNILVNKINEYVKKGDLK